MLPPEGRIWFGYRVIGVRFLWFDMLCAWKRLDMSYE